MKNIFKVALLVAFTAATMQVSAQKSGRINVQEIVIAMPETAAMQAELETIRKDFSDNLETMQVELNNKITEFQNTAATMNDSIRSLKEKDIQDLSQRMQQFEQSAMQEMQSKQQQLLDPILTKARNAVSEVAKAGGYTVVYDEAQGALAYFDEVAIVNLTPAVKSNLGIK